MNDRFWEDPSFSLGPGAMDPELLFALYHRPLPATEARLGAAAQRMRQARRPPQNTGRLIPVLPRTQFSLDARAGSTQEIVLAKAIRTVDWASGALHVRLHAKASWSVSATLTVLVQNTMLALEEPDTPFVKAIPEASLTLTSSDAAPMLASDTVTRVGPMLRVLLRWQQGITEAGGAQTFAIGVTLSGRA